MKNKIIVGVVSALCILIFCIQVKKSNPLLPDYQGDYKLTVVWDSLPLVLDMDINYRIPCTTGTDAFADFTVADAQKQSIDTVLLSHSPNGFIDLKFTKEFHDTLILLGVRPNGRTVAARHYLVVKDPFRPRLTAPSQVNVGKGQNYVTLTIENVSQNSVRVYWKMKNALEWDSLSQPVKPGDIQLPIQVTLPSGWDTLFVWSRNASDSGKISDTVKSALHIIGFSPDVAKLFLPDSLMCGDTLVAGVILGDTSIPSTFNVAIRSLTGAYSDMSIACSYQSSHVLAKMNKPVTDTGVNRFEMYVADSSTVRSRSWFDTVFVKHTPVVVKFMDTTIAVSQGEATSISLVDSFSSCRKYVWTFGSSPAETTLVNKITKIFPDTTLVKVYAYGIDRFEYAGKRDSAMILPRPFDYSLTEVAGFFPDTMTAKHVATWKVAVNDPAKLLSSGGKYYWKFTAGGVEIDSSGPLMTSFSVMIKDSMQCVINVQVKDTLHGSSTEHVRPVVVWLFRPFFKFEKAIDTTRIGKSITIKARRGDTNPDGTGAIDSVYWDTNGNGAPDVVNRDSAIVLSFTEARVHTVTGYARDNDNNYSPVDTARILVKSDRPYFDKPTADTTVFVNMPALFHVSAVPGESRVAVTGYDWKLRGVLQLDTTTVTSSFSKTLATAGRCTVTVTCKDADGLTSANSDTFVVTISKGNPLVSGMKPDSAWIFDTVAYTVSAKEINPTGLLDSIFVQWEPTGSYQAGKDLVFYHAYATAGTKHLKLVAKDNIGFLSDTVSDSVNVDLGRPKMLGIAKDSPIVYVRKPVNYTLSATDPNGTIKGWYLAWDTVDGFRQVINGKVQTSFLSSGVRNVRAYVIDDDSLVSDTLTWQLAVHAGAPVVDSLYPRAVWVNDDTAFTFFSHDTNGTVDSFFIDWGDATQAVKYRSGDVIHHKYVVAKAGIDTVKITAKDNDGMLSNAYRHPLVVRLGKPVVDSVRIDTTGNNLFVNDLRTYRVFAHDTNGIIKTIYAAWDGGATPDTSIAVNISGGGSGLVYHVYDTILAGSHFARFWVRDDDSIMSSSKDTTILVRLAPPALWGDNPTKDTVWTIINNGYGINYNVHINSYDTNGTIGRYYWSEAGSFDTATSNKTNDSLYSRLIGINDVNKGFPIWIYGRDNDGLVRGRQFIAFADSAPPAPVVTFSISAGGGIINWRGKDAKDGNSTQYEILLKKGTTDPVEPTNIISQYNAGSNYSAATVGGFDFSYSFITQGSGEYHCQVITKDARGTISKSTVVISAY